MKKQLVIVGIIVILLTVGLSGCTNDIINNNLKTDIDKFIGSWNGTATTTQGTYNITMTFLSDKTYSAGLGIGDSIIDRGSGSWDIKDGKLITYPKDKDMSVSNFQFSNNEMSLTITNIDTGDKLFLTKQ